MKVNESFAVEATEEVIKDPRFEWYVNWLKSLDKDHMISDRELYFGISVNSTPISYYHYLQSSFNEILTLDEVYSRYGKEIYEANGIEQPLVGNADIPFQGSREYDEKLLNDWLDFSGKDMTYDDRRYNGLTLGFYRFLNYRYPNEFILKQIAEKEAEIEELKKQLR